VEAEEVFVPIVTWERPPGTTGVGDSYVEAAKATNEFRVWVALGLGS